MNGQRIVGTNSFVRKTKKSLIMKDYGYRKVELKRFYVTDSLYFITSVVENHEPVFTNENCVRPLLRALNEYAKKCYVQIIAFVVLPDHLHLLICPKSQNRTISAFMKSVKG